MKFDDQAVYDFRRQSGIRTVNVMSTSREARAGTSANIFQKDRSCDFLAPGTTSG
jgi:hypothetical protein